MFDLHSHILPGIDDGARDPAASVAIARDAAAQGVRLIAATPHVRDDYPTAVADVVAAVARLRTELAAAGVPVEIATGGEVDLEHLRRLSDDDLRGFGLAGNPESLLIETPYYGWPPSLESIVLSLRRKGIRAVLAHPERNPQVQERPNRLRASVEAGAILQITADSLAGGGGRRAQRTANDLLDSGWPCMLASDVHAPGGHRSSLIAARRSIAEELADWLTVRVPAAIVYGGSIPPRPADPAGGQRRRFRFRTQGARSR